MAEFTKEDWQKKGNVIVAFGKGEIARCPSPQNGGVLEFAANAHLIAAAPKMFLALKRILPYAKGNPVIFEPDIEEAEQALALAENKEVE